MRHRHSRSSEPRADGFVVGGLALVVLLTLAAFATSGAFLAMEEPVARAYTLSAMPRAGADADEVTTGSFAREEVAAVRGPVSEPQAEAPICDISRCAAAYRSFDVEDCTFQPFDGPRKLCPY